MKNAGTNVTLTVSSKNLTLVSHETGDIIAQHDMPRISFASGGDTETLDFVAYVAKDLQEWRACYVLECGGDQAQDLIATVGQAFELRYKEFFNKTVFVFSVWGVFKDDEVIFGSLYSLQKVQRLPRVAV